MNKELNKLYEEKGPYFMMALAHLLDHGFNKVMAMTDEQIAVQKGNELMTDEFVQELNRLTRDIARASNGSPMQLISFCTEKELGCNFEIPRPRLEEIASQAISYLSENGELLDFEEDKYIDLNWYEKNFFDLDEDDSDYYWNPDEDEEDEDDWEDDDDEEEEDEDWEEEE